jgi:hypothetical protein
MGYDVFFHHHPDRARADAMLRRFIADPDVVTEAEQAEFAELRDRFYFRANIWMMGRLRDLMGDLGLLNDAAPPPQPTAEQFGIDPEHATEDEWAALHEATERWLRFTAEAPGIPRMKLSDNSGWWITPIEIESALRLLAAHPPHVVTGAIRANADGDWTPRHMAQLFAEWMSFLHRAAREGEGCRVY